MASDEQKTICTYEVESDDYYWSAEEESDSPEPQPTSQNERFKIVKRLVNEGEFNSGIFLVRNIQTEKLCVEKKFRHDHIVDGTAKKELDILKRLRPHPNINELISYQFDGKSQREAGYNKYLFDVNISMETGSLYLDYCDMGSLQTMLTYNKDNFNFFEEQFIWNVMEGLANAVKHCQYGPTDSSHWQSLYHCDIHPGNVFLKNPAGSGTEDMQVVLGDFGCAREPTARGRSVEGVICKMDFEAPEQLESDKYGPTSDVYQIGIVVWCMINANEKVHPTALANWVLDNSQEIGEGRCSNELLHVLWWCLQQNPDVRYTPKQLLAAIANHRPPRTPPHTIST